jgi:hypothetical protein
MVRLGSQWLITKLREAVRPGMAWRGEVGRGEARQGAARHGSQWLIIKLMEAVRPGRAWRGAVGRGSARPG